MAYDFELFQNARGWAVIRPLTFRAQEWAADNLDPEAQAWAAEYGETDEERADYWLDPRDGLVAAEAFIADGLTCPNSDQVHS